MAGERRFTRIPPESSGDRVGMNAFIEVGYTGATGAFSIGDTVNFVTSGLGGEIAYVRVDTGTTGIIVIDLDADSRENNLVATVAENIQVDAVTIAQAATAGIEVYLPKYNLASGTNPLNLQEVDAFGSGHIRFSEGPAQLDAFGKLRISESTVIGNYSFQAGLGIDFTPETSTGGTVTHDATAAHAVLNTTTTSGSASYFTSNLWHHYFPGISSLGMFSLYHGDVGKANNRRRWGSFDEYNGIFFELDGTTLNAVVRSSVSGSVVETKIAQTDWSEDVLDGTGGASNKSNITLDITNINLYWIDYEWLGAGRIRWGVYYNGQRITCHVYNHSNSSSWAKYGSFPIRYENENTGAAGSSSELRVVCCAVHTEADVEPVAQFGNPVYVTVGPVAVNTTADIYVNSLKTTTDTHDTYLLTSIGYMAIEGANNAAVKLDFKAGTTLTTPSWAQIGTSNFELDTAGSENVAGALISAVLIKGNGREPENQTSLQNGSYKSFANGESFSATMTATRVDGIAANCDLYLTYAFREFRNFYG